MLTNSSWQSPGLEELGVWLRLAAAHRVLFFFLPASHLAKIKKKPPPPPLNQPTDDASSKTVVLVTPLLVSSWFLEGKQAARISFPSPLGVSLRRQTPSPPSTRGDTAGCAVPGSLLRDHKLRGNSKETHRRSLSDLLSCHSSLRFRHKQV